MPRKPEYSDLLKNTTQKTIFGLHFYDKNLNGHPHLLQNTTQKAIFGHFWLIKTKNHSFLRQKSDRISTLIEKHDSKDHFWPSKPKITHFYDKNQTGYPD